MLVQGVMMNFAYNQNMTF